MNNVAYFEIQANDPEKVLAFYETLFGWTFTRQESTPVPYWQIKTEGINGGLLQRPAPVPGANLGTNAFTCSMQVESFDQTAEQILALGGSVALPKFAIPGRCWQGYFIDIDGNIFGLFQVEETAA